MGEEDRYSAQCAWLFCHAHLTGEACVECNDGAKIHYSSSTLEALILLFVVLAGEVFLAAVVFFLTGFADLPSFARRAAALAFASDLRCCLARSSRNNSS